MWADDLDWLELTYPAGRNTGSSDANNDEATERICLRRLEAIWWPNGRPICPACGTVNDAAEWGDAPYGIGWRCRACAARFHIRQVVPPMRRTHQRPSVWFRAIFLISSTPDLNANALSKQLGLEYKIAAKIHYGVRNLLASHPDHVRRIVVGRTADTPLRRKSRRPSSATRNITDTAEPDDHQTEVDPAMRLPGAFDVDC